MVTEARDIRLQDRDVAQKPVALRRDRLPAFQGWLEESGWTINENVGPRELLRAHRRAKGGAQYIFAYDGPDATNLLLFDLAAREAERFEACMVGGKL